MKLARFYLVIINILFWCTSSTAQSLPINVQVLSPIPVPTSAPEILGRTGQPVVILTNTSFFSDYKVMLRATIRSNNGISGILDPQNKRPSKSINVPRASSVVLTGDQLITAYANYTPFDINYTGITQAELANNQLFPEGTYIVCATALDYFTGEQLSANPPLGCSPPMKVITPDPPTIIYPFDEASLELGLFENLIFRWTPVNLPTSAVNYRIRIAQVPENVNPYEAIDNPNLFWWEAENLWSTFYLYDISKPRFLEDVEYAVQITAYDPTGNQFIKNDGKSNVHVFRINRRPIEPPLLISPTNNSSLSFQTPQNYQFNWSSSSSAQTPLNYKFRLVEVPEGASGEQVIDKPAYLVYQEEDIAATTFFYDQYKPILSFNKTYAWRVQAYDSFGQVDINNNGYSPIYTFTIDGISIPAPFIEQPIHEEMISLAPDQPMEISWQHDFPPELNKPIYTVEIWEADALEDPLNWIINKYPIFSTTTVQRSLSYDFSEEMLDSGHNFITKIHAQSDEVSMQNDGNSNVVVFQISNTNDGEGGNNNENENENTDDNVVPIVGNFDCGFGCTAEFPENILATNTASVGSVLKIGNFLLNLDQVTWVGNQLSGSGRIQPTEFMPVHLRVTFQNLQINGLNEVFDGTAQVAIDQDFLQVDWINEDAWMPPQWDGSIDEFLNDIDTFADNLDDVIDPQVTTGLSLPLQLNSNEMAALITRINFTPTGATYNLMSYTAIPGGDGQEDRVLIFGAQEICYAPSSFVGGVDGTRLDLLREVEFEPNDNYSLTFFGQNGSNQNSSSFARFDCDGFLDMTLDGLMVFNRDVLIPSGENGPQFGAGGKMGAYFNTITTSIDDMVLSLDFSQEGEAIPNSVFLTPYFELASLPDFTFRVEDAVFDFSINHNAPAMVFPENYTNTGEEWQGVYFKDLEVQMPYWISVNDHTTQAQIERVGFGLHDFLIDGEGNSGKIAADDVVQLEVGAIGTWDSSIEGLNIELLRGELIEGSMSGRIRVPLFDHPFQYDAVIGYNPIDNELNYDFTLIVDDDQGEEADISAWYVGADIDQTTFEVTVDGDEVDLRATFDGDFIFDESIGDYAGFELDRIPFQGLMIGYGSDGFQYELPGVNLQGEIGGQFMGFGFNLNDLQLEERNFGPQSGAAMVLDMNLDIGGAGQGITLGGILDIAGQFNDTDNGLLFQPLEVSLEGLDLDADVAGVIMNGQLNVYTNHSIFGNGFGGQLDVNVAGFARGDLAAKFGTKRTGNTPWSYWYVNGNINMASNPLPLVEPLAVYGFGGGVYYNINKSNLRPINNQIFGIDAGVDLAMRADPAMFNGEFDLNAEFSTQNNGISLHTVSLNGDAKVMSEPEDTGAAPLSLSGNITYNHTVPRLSANLNFNLQIPPSSPQLVGAGNFDFLYSPSQWYLHLGTPQDMVGIQFEPTINILGKNISLGSINFDSYFSTGGGNQYQLPALPDFPSGLSTSVSSQLVRPTSIGSAGFVTGLHTGFDFGVTKSVDLWLTTVGVGFELDAGIGADMTLFKPITPNCHGRSNFGINNWYASGQGYLFLHGSAGVEIAGDIYGAGVRIDAAATFGLPNPTGISAAFGIGVELGPIDLNYNTSATIGEICDFDPGELEESIIRNINLIKGSTIDEGEVIDDLSWKNIRPYPKVETYFRRYSHRIGDTYYSIITEEFKLYEILDNGNKRSVNGLKIVGSGSKHFSIREINYNTVHLKPDTEYEIKVKAALAYTNSSNSTPDNPDGLVEIDGDNIRETFRVRFRTAEISDVIENPSYTLPVNRQRFFHSGDVSTGRIDFDNPYILNHFDMNTRKVVARFIPTDDPSAYQQTDATLQPSGFRFHVPALEADKVYKIGLYLISRTGAAYIRHTFYEYHFQTSKYNTLQAKMDNYSGGIARTVRSYSPVVGFYCDSYTLEFIGDEGFDQIEYDNLKLHLNSSAGAAEGLAAWWIQGYRNRLVDIYTGALNVEEFYLEPVGNLLLGPLSDNEIEQSSNVNNNTNYDYDLSGTGGVGNITVGNTGSGIGIGFPGISNPNTSNTDLNIPLVRLKVRWNLNEYVATVRQQLWYNLALVPTNLRSLVTQDFIPAYIGTYPIRAFNVFPAINKTFDVDITAEDGAEGGTDWPDD